MDVQVSREKERPSWMAEALEMQDAISSESGATVANMRRNKDVASNLNLYSPNVCFRPVADINL